MPNLTPVKRRALCEGAQPAASKFVVKFPLSLSCEAPFALKTFGLFYPDTGPNCSDFSGASGGVRHFPGMSAFNLTARRRRAQ